MTAVLDSTAAIDIDTLWLLDDIGPRIVGGTYLHGSYSEPYTVLKIRPYVHDGMPWSMTVRWHDSGVVTTHSTPWRPARGDLDLTGSTT